MKAVFCEVIIGVMTADVHWSITFPWLLTSSCDHGGDDVIDLNLGWHHHQKRAAIIKWEFNHVNLVEVNVFKFGECNSQVGDYCSSVYTRL